MTKEQKTFLSRLRKLSGSRFTSRLKPECDHIVGFVEVHGEAALINPEWENKVRLVNQSMLEKETEWASKVSGANVAVWHYCPMCRKRLNLDLE